MQPTLYTLQNDHWQVGILPEIGASTAFGRVMHAGAFVDVMRPTAEADYSNSSLCASFIMLPWANRLRDARFRFRGTDYALQPSSADGTAIHGTVRKLTWRIISADSSHIRVMFDSAMHENLNYPFDFSAEAEFRLDNTDFIMYLSMKNEDKQPIPVGFGHHPYFLRAPGSPANAVQLEISCEKQYELVNALPSAPPSDITPIADYRTLRTLGDTPLDALLTARNADAPMRIVYPEWGMDLHFLSDPIFQQALLFAPEAKPFFALEPQTNANDGFNLHDQAIDPAGVIVLESGESVSGECRLRIAPS
jgi:aldose 1-epimerase